MNADDDETPLPRDTAILVAAPMEDPLGPPERRPALAAMMRELASACGLVAPERTINRTDRVSWSTPRGAHPCYELSLTTYRMATGSAMSVDVRLLRGPDEPTRRSMRGEAVMRELGLRLVLRTRVPSTDDLRDHVPRDVLVMLAAFARAAAAALDGTAPLLTTTEWEDASGAIVGDAWFRHLTDAGRSAELSRITNAPAHPLERHTASAVTGSGPTDFPPPPMPPAMEMHVGFDGEIRLEALHRNVMARGAPNPMAVLRATAMMEQIALRGKGR